MEDIVHCIMLDQGELFAVHGFHQVIDAVVLAIQEDLGQPSMRAIHHGGVQAYVPWVA